MPSSLAMAEAPKPRPLRHANLARIDVRRPTLVDPGFLASRADLRLDYRARLPPNGELVTLCVTLLPPGHSTAARRLSLRTH
jgi:hypothetical protein